MAASIFTILDDIAILADDIAVATKVSVTKTAGILGDDIAVGAKQATGFKESRELQVIYKILKGSLINKTIILPMAFIISLIYPPLITIILIFGGFYLAYEGFEGLLNLKSLFSKSKNKDKESNGVEEEDKKIKAAIKTDFILSIEIIILAMSTVVSEPIIIQLVTTSVVALLASIGVYGLVAMIVRLDDFGFLLIEKKYNKTGLFFY
jgi:predicted DNA repair protein MutK